MARMRSTDLEAVPASDLPEGLVNPVGERKHVTVLFADLVDFTAISERLGEEGAFELIQPIRAMMRDAVREYEGTVMDFTGDGVMAVFGAPISVEDAPLRACRAALQLQEAMTRGAAQFQADYGVRPQLRIGINSGPVVVGYVEAQAGKQLTAVGDAVNLASRLQALAEPGTIVLSENTHRVVEGLATTQYLGDRTLKGKGAPQSVFQLHGMIYRAARFQSAVARGLIPYVGRQEELGRLSASLRGAMTSARVIDIVGEPGIGKSRLIHEFKQGLAHEWSFLTGHCSQEGRRTAFYPFIEVVRLALGVQAGTDRRQAAEKVEAALASLDLASAEKFALLLNLLHLPVSSAWLESLDPLLVGLRTRDLLIELLRAWCGRAPIILCLEDLQWMDSSSEELLGKIVQLTQPISLLVLHTRRPDYAPPWLQGPNIETLRLKPLEAADIARIVENRLSGHERPEGFVDFVLRKSEGNALFAEEIAGLLVESPVRGASLTTAISRGSEPLPSSIQAIFGARVDLLTGHQRRLLQIASGIGRQFDPLLLAAVAGERPEALEQSLDALKQSDLLHVDDLTNELVFKHALLRDVIYANMLAGARSVLHLTIAQELERRGGATSEYAELLVHHYGRTAHNDKTFLHAALAAKNSLRVYSLHEAEEFATTALRLLATTPNCATNEGLANLLADYTLTLQLDYDIPTLVQTVEAWLPRIRALGSHTAAVLVLHHYANALILAGCYRESKAVSETLNEMAHALGDDRSLGYAFTVSVWTGVILGASAFEALQTEAAPVLAAAARSSDVYLQVWLRWVLGVDAIHRGLMQQAYGYARELVDLGQLSNDPRATGLGFWLMGWNALINDDYPAAHKFGTEAMRAAVTPWDRSTAMNLTATALILLRRLDEGLPMLAERRTKDAEAGRRYAFVANDAVWGVALVLSGRVAAGIGHINRCISAREAEGYGAAADWYRFALCFVYLDIFQAKQKPPFRVLIKNLPYLIFLRFAAPRRIDRLIEKILCNPIIHPDGLHLAKVHFITGLRWQLAGREELARASLTKARRIAAAFGNTQLTDKMDAAIAQLRR